MTEPLTLKIRPATPDDAKEAAVLLADTMGGYGVMTMGLGSLLRETRILQDWFARPAHRFSYEFCWLAEVDGKTAGLLLTIPGDRLDELERALSKGILRYYNPLELVQMVWRLMVIGRSEEAEKNEYVLAHLAVKESYRRKGIAAALIQKAEELTAENGFNRLVLEVELDNSPARALYLKQGFEVQFTTEFGRHARTLSCPGFDKMVKIIPTRG